MTKLTFIAVGLALLVSACGDDVKVNMTESAPKVIAVKDLKLPFKEDQLCAGIIIETGAGKQLKGNRRCEAAKTVCEKVGDLNCRMDDATKYGVHDSALKPENIRKGVKIGDKQGEATTDYPVCSSDGQTGCITKDGAVSVDATTIAAKTPIGSTVGGVAGSYDPGYPDPANVLDTDTVNGQPGQISSCSAAGQSNCIASAAFKPVPTTELDPAAIRTGATIGGVTGTYQGAFSACTVDAQTDCITTNAFVGMIPGDVTASRVRQNIKLAGVTGSLKERPADCNGSVKVGCTTTTNFPAADYNLVVPGNIKAATSIAGLSAVVIGAYPSAAHPLSPGTADHDLSGSNFNTRIASAETFEYWTSTGARQTATGDADLKATNLANAATIFSVSGSVTPSPDACTNSVDTNCVTTSTHVSYDKNLLIAANIKDGTTIAAPSGNVSGAYPSAAHPLPAASNVADLKSSTFNTQLQDGGTEFEYWDAAGVRHTGQGSSTLISSNLLKGANVFGVTGSSELRPVNCSNSKHKACVASASHPAYDPANLPAAMVKNGTTIGLVTGTYPSANNRLAGSVEGMADLSSTTFNSQLASSANFEYWDDEGNRYTGSGNVALTGGNIASGVKVFGVTGTMTPSPEPCTSAGQNNCLAVLEFPSYNPSSLLAKNIKKGVVIDGKTGTYPSAANPLPDADTGIHDLQNQSDLYSRLSSANKFEFWDSHGQRHELTGDTDFVATNILKDKVILGITGTMIAAPGACTGEGQTNCGATMTYRPYHTSTLTEGVLKKGVSLGGVTGKYPSVDHPLVGNTATRDLFESGASFAAEVTTPGLEVEFWDSSGVHHTKTLEGISAGNVRKNTSILGVEGTALVAPGACTDSTVTSCLTSAAFPSYQQGELTTAILKKDFVIGGVTGGYPSSSHPLTGNTGTPNLDAATFNAKIKSNAEFEYWDANGSRLTATGSGNLIPKNILKEQSIFAVTGTMATSGTITIDMNNVRAGVKVGTQTGTRKVSCANTATPGSTGNETTDDYNGGAGHLPTREPFGSTKSCRENSFKDLTLAAGGPACSGAFDCRYEDKITGMKWRSSKTNGSSINIKWTEALSYCSGVGMRLPTQKEMMTVYVNGIRQASLVNGSLWTYGEPLWLATTPSVTEANRYFTVLQHFNLQHQSTSASPASKRAFCIDD